MARQCAIIPKVLNKRGEKVDSRLFKDLLSYLSMIEQGLLEFIKLLKANNLFRTGTQDLFWTVMMSQL